MSDARRYGAPDLEAYFRRRTTLAGVALIVVAAVGLVVLRFDARHVFDGLISGWGLGFLLLAVFATVCTVWLVRRGNHVGTRLAGRTGRGAIPRATSEEPCAIAQGSSDVVG